MVVNIIKFEIGAKLDDNCNEWREFEKKVEVDDVQKLRAARTFSQMREFAYRPAKERSKNGRFIKPCRSPV